MSTHAASHGAQPPLNDNFVRSRARGVAQPWHVVSSPPPRFGRGATVCGIGIGSMGPVEMKLGFPRGSGSICPSCWKRAGLFPVRPAVDEPMRRAAFDEHAALRMELARVFTTSPGTFTAHPVDAPEENVEVVLSTEAIATILDALPVSESQHLDPSAHRTALQGRQTL